MLEARIAQVEDRLRSATVIAAEDVKTDVVQVGATVSVKDEETGKAQKFTIVGSPEAKPPERLSYESPVGKALLGRKRNDIVDVALPNGRKIQLKITKIDVGAVAAIGVDASRGAWRASCVTALPLPDNRVGRLPDARLLHPITHLFRRRCRKDGQSGSPPSHRRLHPDHA